MAISHFQDSVGRAGNFKAILLFCLQMVYFLSVLNLLALVMNVIGQLWDLEQNL